MSLYLQDDSALFFGRKSILVAEKETRLSDYEPCYFPKKMIMSLTSRCNLRCAHCMRSRCADMGDSAMTREMVDHVVRTFFPKITCMQLGGIDFGEQMLSPHFGYFLSKVQEYGVGLDLVTNGTLIRKDNAGALASSAARVMLSVEGIGPNYKKVRGVGWERFRGNIEALLEARSSAGTDDRAIVCLNICAIREFRDDYFRLADYSKEAGVDLMILRDLIPNRIGERAMSFLYHEHEHNEFYSELKEHAEGLGVKIAVPPPIPLEKRARNQFRRKACTLPFEVFGLLSDGKIVTCCLGEAFDLGQLSTDDNDIMPLWNSERYKQIRNSVNTMAPPEPCRLCEAVNYNALAYRPTKAYLMMKQLLTERLPGARRFKNIVKKGRRALLGQRT